MPGPAALGNWYNIQAAQAYREAKAQDPTLTREVFKKTLWPTIRESLRGLIPEGLAEEASGKVSDDTTPKPKAESKLPPQEEGQSVEEWALQVTGIANPDTVTAASVERLAGEDTEKGPGAITRLGVAMVWQVAFNIIAIFLGKHWRITDQEAKAIARAYMAWIPSLPKPWQKMINKVHRELFPLMGFAGTLIEVCGPRVRTSMKMIDENKAVGGTSTVASPSRRPVGGNVPPASPPVEAPRTAQQDAAALEADALLEDIMEEVDAAHGPVAVPS